MSETTNQKHPHAFVLQALADGVPLSNFEVQYVDWTTDTWESAEGYHSWIPNPYVWRMREKQKYIVVNGFKVPKPAKSVARTSEYYLAAIRNCEACTELGFNHNPVITEKLCKTGFVHLTKKAAFQHALALTGVDPAKAEARDF